MKMKKTNTKHSIAARLSSIIIPQGWVMDVARQWLIHDSGLIDDGSLGAVPGLLPRTM